MATIKFMGLIERHYWCFDRNRQRLRFYWVPGYSVLSATGAEGQPWMPKREAQRIAKEQG
jgi:hypothetical protein